MSNVMFPKFAQQQIDKYAFAHEQLNGKGKKLKTKTKTGPGISEHCSRFIPRPSLF